LLCAGCCLSDFRGTQSIRRKYPCGHAGMRVESEIKMAQADLFGQLPAAPYRGAPPFQKHSDTSREAAARIKYRVGKLHRDILEYLKTNNATDEEMQKSLAMPTNTQRPRRRELELMGYVADSNKRRIVQSGRMAVVWKLAQE